MDFLHIIQPDPDYVNNNPIIPAFNSFLSHKPHRHKTHNRRQRIQIRERSCFEEQKREKDMETADKSAGD